MILYRRKFLACFLKIKMATSQTRFKWIDDKLINLIKYLQELIHYDELLKIWGGSPASKPLSYWTSTICISYNMNATSQTRFKWIDDKLINLIKYLQELIHYDELLKMWGGCPASKPLSYWTSTICINYNMNADNFPDNIRSSSSNSLSNNSPYNYGHSSN